VPHQILVGVTQDVIAVGAVLTEIERPVFKNGDEVGEPLYHLLATAELAGIVEVRHVGQFVCIGQRADNFLVDPVADVRLALEGDHVFEASAGRDGDRRVRHARVLVADILDE
jgi:hypothetical protein